MPAKLVPHAAIPDLAGRVSRPEVVKALQRIKKAGFILNDEGVDEETASVLRELTELGLVDPAYEGDTSRPPSMWVSNGNGSRVVEYLTGIRAGPFYEIPATELAAWLEEQGQDRWWNVDGDALLTGRMSFPCPARDLAEELRKIGRPLLLQGKRGDRTARGQLIGKAQLNGVVGHFADDLHVSGQGQLPPWSGDRLLYLCWKERPDAWLLVEDSETTEQFKEDGVVKAK